MARESRKQEPLTRAHIWDVLIVGAGPSGLFAALGITLTSNLKVLLVDSGPDIEQRRRAILQGSGNADGSDYLKGLGGAGLFSDGKLCFSLDVGGYLKDALTQEKKTRLLNAIATVFGSLIEFKDLEMAQQPQIAAAKDAAARVGLEFKYYPVLHIGTERCRDVISGLKQYLSARGVAIITQCELLSLTNGNGYVKRAEVAIRGEIRTVRARQVVLALGKVGAPAERDICAKLGVASASRPMFVGVRVETSAEAARPLFALAKDPKYSLRFRDGSRIKTHCASDGGQVLALHYDGLPVAGGQSFHDLFSGRSSFSILWDGIPLDGDAYRVARTIMQKIHNYSGGRLLIQTLADYLAGLPSRTSGIQAIPVSNRICQPGDIRVFLPKEYFERFDEFLFRLSKIAPGILGDQTVLYAPAIEWWMSRIEVVDAKMQTSRTGVYVCGDGSGWSQGIVHAAATGLLVAEGITRRSVDEALTDPRFQHGEMSQAVLELRSHCSSPPETSARRLEIVSAPTTHRDG